MVLDLNLIQMWCMIVVAAHHHKLRKKKVYSLMILLTPKIVKIQEWENHNKVLKLATTPYVFVLNPDTILGKNCIKHLVDGSNKLGNNFTIVSIICL